MKVEFLVNTDINDGRQIFIQESEFKKAKNDEEEFNSFAFATHCLFSFCGAVIITVVEEKYPRRVYPEVFVSNNNKLKRVQL